MFHVSMPVGERSFLVITGFVCEFPPTLGSFLKVRKVDMHHLFAPAEANTLAALGRSCIFQPRAIPMGEICPQPPSSPLVTPGMACRDLGVRWLWEVSLRRVAGDYRGCLPGFRILCHLPGPAGSTCCSSPPFTQIVLSELHSQRMGLRLSRSVLTKQDYKTRFIQAIILQFHGALPSGCEVLNLLD